jgi:hypothetical protein
MEEEGRRKRRKRSKGEKVGQSWVPYGLIGSYCSLSLSLSLSLSG